MESRKHLVQQNDGSKKKTNPETIDHFLRKHWKLVLPVFILCIFAILITGIIVLISQHDPFHHDVQFTRNKNNTNKNENTIQTKLEDIESKNFLLPTKYSNLNSSVKTTTTTTRGRSETLSY